MENIVRTSAITTDLFEVYVKNECDKWEKQTVYTTLCADGSGYDPLPEEIYKVYNGVEYAPRAKK